MGSKEDRSPRRKCPRLVKKNVNQKQNGLKNGQKADEARWYSHVYLDSQSTQKVSANSRPSGGGLLRGIDLHQGKSASPVFRAPQDCARISVGAHFGYNRGPLARGELTCPVGSAPKWWFRGEQMSGHPWHVWSHVRLASAPLILSGLLARSSSSPSPRPRSAASANPIASTPNAAPDRRRGGRADHSLELHGAKNPLKPTFFTRKMLLLLDGHNEKARPDFPGRPQRTVPRTITGPAARDVCSSRRRIPPRKNGTAFECPLPIGIQARTGFAAVEAFPEMRATVRGWRSCIQLCSRSCRTKKKTGGYPHEKAVVEWLQLAAPQAKLKDVRQHINALRQIKSPANLLSCRRPSIYP